MKYKLNSFHIGQNPWYSYLWQYYCDFYNEDGELMYCSLLEYKFNIQLIIDLCQFNDILISDEQMAQLKECERMKDNGHITNA